MTFNDIYTAHYKTTVKFARRHLSNVARGDTHVATQLANDIFLELHKELEAGAVFQNIPGYIHAKMRTKVVDYLRRHYSPRQLSQEELDPQYMIDETQFHDDQLAIREQLDNAFGRLKPVERQAIQLCYVDGHTHREAAAVQQVPVSTFEKRLLSATHKARHYLKGQNQCCELIPCTTSPSPLTMATN